jgi:hypothetical protein
MLHENVTPNEARELLDGLHACETQLRIERSRLDQKIAQLVAVGKSYEALAHPPRRIGPQEIREHNAQIEAKEFFKSLTPAKLKLLRKLAQEAEEAGR